MESLENNELPEQELDRLLREWKARPAPEGLRRKVFPARERWWRGFWSTSIRVPLPVACCLLIVLAVMAWQRRVPSPAPPVASPSSLSPSSAEMPRFEAVRELQPRIIREQDAQ